MSKKREKDRKHNTFFTFRYFRVGRSSADIINNLGSGTVYSWTLLLDNKAREVEDCDSEKFSLQLSHQLGFMDMSSDVLELYVGQKTDVKVLPKHFEVSQSFRELPRRTR